MLNERALVIKSPEVRFALNTYLNYSVSNVRIDKKQSNMKRKKVFKVDVEEHSYLIEDGTPFYSIPRGLAEILPEDEFNKLYETTHNLEIPDDFDYDYVKYCLPGIELRADQVDAVLKSLHYKRGINQLATGSGKSIIICAIIKIILKYNPNSKLLLVLPYEHLQKAFADYFDRFGISYEISTNIKDEAKANITITSAVSILNRRNNLPLYSGVIYDEAQHLQSSTWTEIAMNLVNAEVALGFSAKVVEVKNIFNPKIKFLSPSEALAIGATGKVISYIPPSVYISEGVLATPVLMSINNQLNPILEEEQDWHKSVQFGIMDPKRNDMIGQVCEIFTKANRRILVLASTHQHSFDLATAILTYNPNIMVGISHGGNVGYMYKQEQDGVYSARAKSSDIIQSFKDKEINILIGTSHMDEGADLPDLDVCILASAGKKSRRLIQKVGRSLRISKTGNYAYLIDFEDNNSRILHRHYNERMRTYVSDIGIPSNRLYKGLSIGGVSDVFRNLENIKD